MPTPMSCQLRPWRAEDLDALVRHANNPLIASQLRDVFPYPYTRADGERWLRVAVALADSAMAIDVDGEAVGGIGMNRGKDVERVSAEVGYWLGQAHWGKGIATDALRQLIRRFLAMPDLSRLFAVPLARNLASRRVLEKAGFTLDCILRKSAIKAGEVQDQALYSYVRER